ncbi:MAG TPA: hypothetical protein VIH14_07525, partial [Anaerolineales bacterium]
MSAIVEKSPRPALEAWRLYAFIGVIAFALFIFIARLFYLQVLEHENWLRQANANRTETISLASQRGVIYDRNGIVLAQNVASYNIIITPALLPDDAGDIEEIETELANLSGVPITKGSIEEPLIPCGDNLGIREMVEIQTSFSPY